MFSRVWWCWVEANGLLDRNPYFVLSKDVPVHFAWQTECILWHASKNGSKSTEPWVYITGSIWVKTKSGYLLLAWYIFFCFDNTSLMFFFCLISVHLHLSNKKLFNVSQGTGFLQFSCHWNGCTVCTRESLKKRHQLLVFKCNCSWEMRSRNGD